jgi:hypothetical protein
MGVISRLPLLAEPESLAIVHEDFQRRRLAIAEDKDRPDERVLLQRFLAEPRQSVDSPAKIGRFDGHQDLHLRRDLEHYRTFQKLRNSASTSAASYPTSCTRMVAPAPLSNSSRHSLPTRIGAGNSTNVGLLDCAGAAALPVRLCRP